MLTFVGEGYSPAFTDNYRRIARRLSAGEPIEIVSGPDDICAPLIAEGTEPHCLAASVRERDALSQEAVSELFGRPIEEGAAISPDASMLRKMRENFASGALRKACSGCDWQGLCDRIVGEGYAGTMVDSA
jgi:uncharacterized protein